MALPNRTKSLLNVTIGANATQIGPEIGAPFEPTLQAFGFQVKLVVAGGGGTAKAYIQTSLDGGATWFDVACVALTTATATRVGCVRLYVATAGPIATPADGALTDNTILDGIMGDRVRCKLITAGTAYSGASSVAVTGAWR